MLMKEIERKYSRMTPTSKKIAEYLHDKSEDLLFCTLAELAGKIGTSTAAVVRFATFMGYSGYSKMQEYARTNLAPKTLVVTSGTNGAGFDPNLAKQVCHKLKAAKDILIVGYTDAYGTGAELLHRLYRLKNGNVHFARQISGFDMVFDLMRPETVTLVVTFAPHYLYAVECAVAAQKRNSEGITFSDSPLHPLTEISTLTVSVELAKSSTNGFYDLSPMSAYLNFLFDIWVGDAE